MKDEQVITHGHGPGEFTTSRQWVDWLRQIDPVLAVRIGAILTDGRTTKEIAEVVDELAYRQTIAGGGKYTQPQLASLLGVAPAAIARRAGRWLKASRAKS